MRASFQGVTPIFHVFDVPSSIAFYRDMLGFEKVSSSRPFDEHPGNYGWAMLRRDTVSLMVNNMYEEHPSGRAGCTPCLRTP